MPKKAIVSKKEVSTDNRDSDQSVGKSTVKSIKIDYIFAIGRRKTAIANVKMAKGSGKIFINDKEEGSPNRVYTEPLKAANLDKAMDCWARVHGGGIVSQLEAIRLGIARALVKNDPELRKTLKLEGFLRRDPRMKERKKPGLKGARRAPQWAKR